MLKNKRENKKGRWKSKGKKERKKRNPSSPSLDHSPWPGLAHRRKLEEGMKAR